MKNYTAHRSLLLFVLLFFFVTINSVFADYNRMGVPDSSEIRRKLLETWIEAPLSYVRNNSEELHENSVGETFQVRLEENDSAGSSEFAIIVAPELRIKVDVQESSLTGGTHKTEETLEYPAGAPGSWILFRDSVSGKANRICYYYQADSDVYVQFYSEGTKTLADMVVFGSYAAKGIPVGVPLKRFYTASFNDVMQLTQKTLPWDKTLVYTGMYTSSISLIKAIRTQIQYERFFSVPDAAYDEYGRPVYISTGKERREIYSVDEYGRAISVRNNGRTADSRGFVKWIIDGLANPLIGSGIKLASLNKVTTSHSPTGLIGTYNQHYAISSALDWCRNLSKELLSARTGRDYTDRDSGTDVTENPFAAEKRNGRNMNSTGYIKETGYQMANLKALLYVLAVSEPNTFYLAAIKERGYVSDSGEGKKTKTEIHVFNRCAAIFPYFDNAGRFKCSVFMDGKEIPLATFMDSFKEDFVHLSRVKASDMFFPLY